MVQVLVQSTWMMLTVLGLRAHSLAVVTDVLEMSVPIVELIWKMPLLSVDQVRMLSVVITYKHAVNRHSIFGDCVCMQYVLLLPLSVHMVVLMVSSHHASPVSSVVIMSLTVLEGKMNWITTVLVDLREQYV